MLRERDLCKQYDLSSVRFVFSGAAPLGEETITELEQLYPAWKIGQAYGKLLSAFIHIPIMN
jgi:acyl-coenzyme A synthetase/AMP-(fatty) acid ligase